MFKTLSNVEFKRELENGDCILIDVRTDGERIKFGKISENQLNIDIYNPKATEQILALDKKKKYLIYCWHGNRSLVVLNFMKQNGFSWACDLERGIVNWKD
ncbi:MAG: rhodanese-like domain-containing protein [Candidatus Gracilibacteria bacterium]|nr:rhodanese-like domain-containing protein [Candidatus Gracilibacteria bacterium]